MQNLTNQDLDPAETPNSSIQTPYIQNICELFQAEATKHPHSVAALFENTQITYAELDQKSTALATYLTEIGVKQGTVVGLSLLPNIHLLIGILAILKTGAVYLPLDPNYPLERLRYMLNDARPAFLLTESDFIDRFKDYTHPLILLDTLNWQELTDRSSINPQPHQNQPDQLAYLIYTSGSTGNPKGIMIPFRCFAHFATTHRSYYPSEIIGLVTGSISFDICTLTIFHVLIAGGIVCFPKPSSGFDATATIELINKKSVNYLLCVPSLYSVILEKCQPLPSLKTVSLAGETIPRGLAELHAQLVPNALLYNEYAPSECACGATIAKIYNPLDKQTQQITIGKPLPNTEIYLLDSELHPVKQGDKGEIFIGGLGLALGYLNRPELTDERFLTLSLPGKESVRLYRTGDYGKFLTDGNLEFHGRIDYQVKIKGYRIELNEIEYAICQYTSIQEASVIVREDAKGTKRLVAYFSSNSVNPDMISHLREHLMQTLPPQMLPSVIEKIDQFPRTPNGKIDREALAKRALKEKIDSESVGHQSKTTQTLVSIWKEILNRENVGIHDNFFDIGGDSLNIARLQTFIETTLKINIPVIELLQYSTIDRLTQYLDSQKTTRTSLTNTLSDKKKNAFQRIKKERQR